MKHCRICKQYKSLDIFYADKSRSDGRQPLCKDCHNIALKNSIMNNPERRKNVAKKYRDANIEKCRLSCRVSKSKIIGRTKANDWIYNNKEKVKAYKSNNLAMRRGASGKHSQSQIQELYNKQQGKCSCCRIELNDKYHKDHVFPISLGGSNEIYNIQLLCKMCNLKKGNKDPLVFMQSNGYLL